MDGGVVEVTEFASGGVEDGGSCDEIPNVGGGNEGGNGRSEYQKENTLDGVSACVLPKPCGK